MMESSGTPFRYAWVQKPAHKETAKGEPFVIAKAGKPLEPAGVFGITIENVTRSRALKFIPIPFAAFRQYSTATWIQ
jgi:hypothetical protein